MQSVYGDVMGHQAAAIDRLNLVAKLACISNMEQARLLHHQEESKEDEFKEDERTERRRQQIAAASRKSRAKRKRELEDLRDENSNLYRELLRARKRLKDLDQDVESIDEVCHQFSETHSDSSSVTGSTSSTAPSTPIQDTYGDKMKSEIRDFISSRLKMHFVQLKKDAILFCGRNASAEEQVQLQSITNEIRFSLV